MLPHSAQPAEAAEDAQTTASKRDDGERSKSAAGNGRHDGGRNSDGSRGKGGARNGRNDDGERSKSAAGNGRHDGGRRDDDGNSNGSRIKGARGTATTSSPAFVPPLAPSPPPGTPPTVHTRPESGSSNSTSSTVSAEQGTTELEPGSFGSILSGEATMDSSGRAYHLRTSFQPMRSAQRLVPTRASWDAQEEVLQERPHREGTYSEEQHLAAQHAETQGQTGVHPQEDGHPHESDPSRADAIRRTAVTVCTAAALATAYALTRTTSGWPQINNSPGSVLDPSISLLGAYPWIWLAWVPVLAGAAGYAVWQWLPAQRTNPRQAWTGPISAGSAAVGAMWLWAVHAGNPAAAAGNAAIGIGIGLAAIHLSNTWAAGSRAERASADVPAAVLLGASTIALLAGLGSWLTALDTDVAGWGAEAWSLIALVATVIGITTVSMTDRGHLAAALTVVAGLTAIGFARILTGEISGAAAAGAFIGGFLILVSAGSRRHQVDHAQRRREREWLKAEASAPAAGEALEAVRT